MAEREVDYFAFTPEALGSFMRILCDGWSERRGVRGVENVGDAKAVADYGFEAISYIRGQMEAQVESQDSLVRSVMADLDALPVVDE